MKVTPPNIKQITLNISALTAGQRAMIAEKLATLPHGGAIYKNGIDLTNVRSMTQAEAAEKLATTPKAISQALAILVAAIGG